MSVICWALLVNEISGDFPIKPKVLEIIYTPEELCSSLYMSVCLLLKYHNGKTYSPLLRRHSYKICVMPIMVMVIMGSSRHYLLWLWFRGFENKNLCFIVLSSQSILRLSSEPRRRTSQDIAGIVLIRHGQDKTCSGTRLTRTEGEIISPEGLWAGPAMSHASFLLVILAKIFWDTHWRVRYLQGSIREYWHSP